ncbi:MAG: dTMP kinase [Phycisphaerales bacterium]|nr:dTMP kinase [Phycisphaerales bacterium]
MQGSAAGQGWAGDESGTVAAAAWVRGLAARFVVFEGPDGSGKSTQFRRLSRLATASGLTLCEVRDPGGTQVGERIREVLLDRSLTDMGVTCETLLYMASRAELVEHRIMPGLRRGEFVLADRFVPSTMAYQGAAGGVPASQIAAVARMATHGLMPDIVVVFDLDEMAAAKRLSPLLDRMEAKGAAFHRKVRDGYLRQAADDPGRYIVVDASVDEERVWESLVAALIDRLRVLPPAAHLKSGRAGGGA